MVVSKEMATGFLMLGGGGALNFVNEFALTPRRDTARVVFAKEQIECVRLTQSKSVNQRTGGGEGLRVSTLARHRAADFFEV